MRLIINIVTMVGVYLDDLPIKGTRQTPTRGYKRRAGQSLPYKHRFNVYDLYMYKSINYGSVTRRQWLFKVSGNQRLAWGFEPTAV